MTQTIESFVEKLHADGVEAGRRQAEKIKTEAAAEAESIVAQARQQAEKIVADARAESAKTSERERSELDLAIRDKILAFREAMGKAVEAVLSYEAGASLGSPDFLPQLIHDVVVKYAEADALGSDQIEIRVSPEEVQTVTDWALKYIAANDPHRAHVDLKSTLKGIGFEYQLRESTVEITQDSIVEALSGQINPRLREVLERVIKG